MTHDPTSHPYPVTFTEPARSGYLYVGMRVDPPRHAPFVRASARRNDDIQECKQLAQELEALDEVVSVTVYEAVVIPPVKTSPKFDVLALVQTTSPETIPTVQDTKAYRLMDTDLAMPARNIRRIGDVDRTRAASFLFNHFAGPDPERALQTFDDIAGWFTHKAGVTDSALLQPTGESPYVFVNHVLLPAGPIRFLLNFAKPSFRTHVASRLNANQIDNAPVICKPV